MKFSEMPYQRPDLEAVLAGCKSLAVRLAAAESGEELIHLYREENDFLAHYRTAQVLKDAFHMWKIERPIQRRIPCQPEEEIYETRAYKVPITLVRKKNGGKAIKTGLCKRVSAKPVFAAPLSSRQISSPY